MSLPIRNSFILFFHSILHFVQLNVGICRFVLFSNERWLQQFIFFVRFFFSYFFRFDSSSSICFDSYRSCVQWDPFSQFIMFHRFFSSHQNDKISIYFFVHLSIPAVHKTIYVCIERQEGDYSIWICFFCCCCSECMHVKCQREYCISSIYKL